MPSALTDEALMQRFAAGETAAFDLLFERYRDRVFRYIRAVYSADTGRAEDWTQEAFLRVIRYRDRFDPQYRFSAWLFTIASRVCANGLRTRARHPQDEAAEPVPERLADDRTDAANVCETADLAALARQAVARLPEPLRKAFVLREIEDLSYAEIAAITETSEGNVRVRVCRARDELRTALDRQMKGATA